LTPLRAGGEHSSPGRHLAVTCSKFLTTSDCIPRLQARLAVEQQLTDAAAARGWPREAERHQATGRRLQ
jgi:hypothetical protein